MLMKKAANWSTGQHDRTDTFRTHDSLSGWRLSTNIDGGSITRLTYRVSETVRSTFVRGLLDKMTKGGRGGHRSSSDKGAMDNTGKMEMLHL